MSQSSTVCRQNNAERQEKSVLVITSFVNTDEHGLKAVDRSVWDNISTTVTPVTTVVSHRRVDSARCDRRGVRAGIPHVTGGVRNIPDAASGPRR